MLFKFRHTILIAALCSIAHAGQDLKIVHQDTRIEQAIIKRIPEPNIPLRSLALQFMQINKFSDILYAAENLARFAPDEYIEECRMGYRRAGIDEASLSKEGVIKLTQKIIRENVYQSLNITLARSQFAPYVRCNEGADILHLLGKRIRKYQTALPAFFSEPDVADLVGEFAGEQMAVYCQTEFQAPPVLIKVPARKFFSQSGQVQGAALIKKAHLLAALRKALGKAEDAEVQFSAHNTLHDAGIPYTDFFPVNNDRLPEAIFTMQYAGLANLQIDAFQNEHHFMFTADYDNRRATYRINAGTPPPDVTLLGFLRHVSSLSPKLCDREIMAAYCTWCAKPIFPNRGLASYFTTTQDGEEDIVAPETCRTLTCKALPVTSDSREGRTLYSDTPRLLLKFTPKIESLKK